MTGCLPMRKRVSTTIEQTALNELDIKIIKTEFKRKERSSYLEFLIRLLPYIPDGLTQDIDIREVIKLMYERVILEKPLEQDIKQNMQMQNSRNDKLNDVDRAVIESGKNLALTLKNLTKN